MEKEKRINELEENIKAWREELNTVWQGRDTDAAEVERRNLRDLINNAEREIDQLRGNAEIVNENPEERFNKLKEEFEKIKQGNSDDKLVEINKLKLQIERMKEERENYASRKNTEYKEIYDAYTKGTDRKEKVIVTDEKTGEQKEEEKTIHSKGIEDLEKDLEQLEKEYEKGKSGERDKNIRAVTALRQEYDKQIKDKEKEIRKIKRQIEDIELGTDEAMVEKELSDGTKVKTPKILELNKDLDKLEKELRELISNRDECEQVINQLKGIEKEEKPEYTEQQNAEYTKYFHGQGDIPENTRDDRRANDEYSGFEKPRDGKKPIEPVGKDPEGKTPPPSGTDEKDPKGKGSTEKDFAKIQVIEINEENVNIFFKDTKGETGNMDKDYAFISKDQLMRKLGINEKCREIAGGRIRGSLLKRKLNPEILMVLEKYPEQCEEYIRSIKSKEKTPFDVVHNLEGARLIDKLKMNKYVRAERKSGTMVLGGILSPKISEGVREKAKALVESAKQQASTIKKKDVVEKIDNKDNHIEKNAVERIQEQSEKGRAKEVQSMMQK